MKINSNVYYPQGGKGKSPENIAQLQKMLGYIQERIVKLEQGNTSPEEIEEKEERNKRVSETERRSMVAEEIKKLKEQAESLKKRIQALQGKVPKGAQEN